MTTVPLSVGTATLPVVRALLEQARDLKFTGGVLGVRARPHWDGPERFDHAGTPVLVRTCDSVLAVREALLDRDPARWLVVLTDRGDSELGPGIRAHFAWQRLRTPDPWDAVRARFRAATLDAALTTGPGQRELAAGLLATSPVQGDWPPAGGGVLTRDHALRSVATLHLGFGDAGIDLDAPAVLAWTAHANSVVRLADLRALGGEALLDALLPWLADCSGVAAPAVGSLLASGRVTDVVPLGLVTGVLDAVVDGPAAQAAREALVRLEPVFGGQLPAVPVRTTWAAEAHGLVSSLLLLSDGVAARLLSRADTLLQDLRASGLAETSDLLASSLTLRLTRLSAALRVALVEQHDGGDGQAWLPATALRDVEQAWTAVTAHRQSELDPRTAAFRAAVRLMRWLATPTTTNADGLAGLTARHRDIDAWVDAATSDAAGGVADPELGEGLSSVLAAVRARRDQHDVAFAAALADDVRDDRGAVPALEDLLPSLVLPLAESTPVLLLVCDGMSVAVAAEVAASITGLVAEAWVEVLPEGQHRRGTALAVLPSLTEHSRASLLSGTITSGSQDVERAGHRELARAHGLTATLFHKKELDETPPGRAVASVVAQALDDVAGTRLVTCVLNTIDDALDRSDPGGTDWSLETVKHLRALLERARFSGRTVVLTSDHGHVIERRQGRVRAVPEITSGRSRTAQPPPGEGEVLVDGRRVVGGRAVLAVDEGLRYGPLKAGYHGGASPAEVIVPVCVLVSGAVPQGWQAAGPQEPAWWWTPLPVEPEQTPVEGRLFELPRAREPVSPGQQLAAALLASPTYADQKRMAGRVDVRDEQVAGLVAALLDAPGHRLAPQPAALALGEAPARMRGALAQVRRLLGIEGYEVLSVDADGGSLLLDEHLLREQFSLS